jgi:hypothetical protein
MIKTLYIRNMDYGTITTVNNEVYWIKMISPKLLPHIDRIVSDVEEYAVMELHCNMIDPHGNRGKYALELRSINLPHLSDEHPETKDVFYLVSRLIPIFAEYDGHISPT